MGYDYSHPENRRRAASLLHQLKGRLHDVAGVRVEALSNAYASAEAYWQLSKASGVHVYRSGDGWHADLEFQDLPRGIPDIIGTPAPAPTRAEALESVVGMMSMCAQRDAVPPPDPATGLRWFRFDEHEIPVDAAMLADYVGRAASFGVTQEDAFEELAYLRLEIAGSGPVTPEAWRIASFESRYEACKACCMAMALGIRQTRFDPGMLSVSPPEVAAPAIH